MEPLKDVADVVANGGNPLDPKHLKPVEPPCPNRDRCRHVLEVKSQSDDAGKGQEPLTALSIAAALGEEEERLERGVDRLPTGWPRLDTALGGGLVMPSLNVLGAGPKSGKSTWAQITAIRHVEAGGVAYILDRENGRLRVLRQILCRRAHLGPKEAAKALADERACAFASREEAERWREAKAWVRGTLGPRFFLETTMPQDFAQRIAALRELAGDRKLLAIIDSLQKMPGDPHDDRRTAIDKWIRFFERLRYEHRVAFLLISEIRRGLNGYRAREDAFKESGDIEYSADLALTLNRPAADEEENGAPPTLRIELVRDCPEDPRGEVASYEAVRPWYGLEEIDPVPISSRKQAGKVEEAATWLRALLAAGPVKVSEVITRGEAAGFSRATVYRARRSVGAQECTLTLRKAWRLP